MNDIHENISHVSQATGKHKTNPTDLLTGLQTITEPRQGKHRNKPAGRSNTSHTQPETGQSHPGRNRETGHQPPGHQPQRPQIPKVTGPRNVAIPKRSHSKARPPPDKAPSKQDPSPGTRNPLNKDSRNVAPPEHDLSGT